MGKLFFAGAIALAVVSGADSCWAGARVAAVTGLVRAYMAGSDTPQEVAVGQILPDGTEVRTTETGQVTLEFEAGNTVRLRENGRIRLAAPEGKKSRMALLSGKLKGIFSRLTGGRQFELEFPNGAVCAVKGTELVAEISPEGAFLLNVLFGAVELALEEQRQTITQGCGAASGEGAAAALVNLLTQDQINDGLADWESGDGGLTAEQSRQARRDAMQDVLEDLKVQIAQAREQTSLLREEDFAAGRTMRDVHGNLVRVDQRLGRPNPKTIQFVNLVKRDAYNYRGYFRNANIVNGPRLDYAEAKMEMNMDLPSSLFDWPQFFSDNQDNVDMVRATLTLANGGVRDVNRDTIVQMTEWFNPDGTRRVDEYGDDDPKDTFLLNGEIFVPFDGEKNSDLIPGPEPGTYIEYLLADGSSPEDDLYQADGEATDSLWTINSTAFLRDRDNDGIGDYILDGYKEFYPDSEVVFLNLEAYVINNDGKILNADDFTDSKLDPFAVLKNTAVEGIVSASTAPAGRGDPLLKRGNIDIVVTPDIVLAAVEKLASAISDINTSDGDENNTMTLPDQTLPQ